MGFPRGGHRTKGDSFSSDHEGPAQVRRRRASRDHNNNRFAPGLVGARLRERRLERGITLRQFARDIDVSASFISQLETGKAQPSVATFYSICAALDISIDELFNYDEPMAPAAEETTNGRTDAAHNNWLNAEEVPPPGQRSCSSRKRDITGRATNERKCWSSIWCDLESLIPRITTRQISCSCTTRSEAVHLGGSAHSTRGNGVRIHHQGTLQIALGFDTYELNAGDSICFDSSRPIVFTHGDVAVEAIWVNLEFRGN